MVSLIYSTIGSEEEARKISRDLVSKKLVACVNIIPKIVSIYRWKGQIEEDTETILIAKTTEKNIDRAVDTIKSLHSCELPDIVVIPITTGLKTYLDYVKSETL